MLHAFRNTHALRDMPIWKKLLTVNLGIALLISAVSLIGFQAVVNQSNRMIYTQTANSMTTVSDKIASRIKALLEASLTIAVNREFQGNLLTLNTKPLTADQAFSRTDITRILYHAFNSDIITISVYPLHASPIILGFSSAPEEAAVLERAHEMAADAKGAPVCLPSNRKDGSLLIAREIRSLDAPFLDRMGLLLFRVNMTKIVQASSEELLSGDYAISIDQNGENLYPHHQGDDTLSIDEIFHHDDAYAIRRLDDQMHFVTRSRIRTYPLDWDFMLRIPYGEVFFSRVFANTLFVLCLILTVFLSVILSRRILGNINGDIKLLTQKMDRVREGDLTPQSNPENLGHDELGILNRHFDSMTADFKRVIEDNYIKQLMLSQTQLKALEQQINPHFLYNSLETINWFARGGETRKITDIAQALGRLLRSTLSEDGDCIPLSRELSILESYLRIQCIRFPDTLRVSQEIAPETMEALIPKMSIQPLVENAIVHSLEENVGVCHIQVRVSSVEDQLLVEVENDGSEIDEDMLVKLHTKTVHPKGNGIGLINIDSRIKLLFGEAYGLMLKNLDDGVIASYRIPLTTGGSGEKRADPASREETMGVTDANGKVGHAC